jgi:hypothetical protein
MFDFTQNETYFLTYMANDTYVSSYTTTLTTVTASNPYSAAAGTCQYTVSGALSSLSNVVTVAPAFMNITYQ